MARSPLFLSLAFFHCFLSHSLLLATVSAGFDDSRCGQDMACFVNRCAGEKEDEHFRLYKSRDGSEKPDKCQIRFAVKKLDNETYVLFVRHSLAKTSNFSLNIGESVFSIVPINGTMQAKDKLDIKMDYQEYSQSKLYEARLEFKTLRDSLFGATVIKGSFPGRITAINNENDARIAIEKSETCSTNGMQHFTTNNIIFQTMRVDLSEQRLTCAEGFTLSAVIKGQLPPVPIPETFCENKMWQTEFVAISEDKSLSDLINAAQVLSESGGEDMKQITITDDIAIGCVRNIGIDCDKCNSPPPITTKCENCIPPIMRKVDNKNKDKEYCSDLECPHDYEFFIDGVKASRARPMCYDNTWYKIYPEQEGIREISCVPVENKHSSEQNEQGNTGAINPAAITKAKRNRNKNRTMSSDQYDGQTAGEWLRANWISVLTPLIMIAFTIGGIIFIVFMLRTKDEQDVFFREEQRRDEERRDNGRDDFSLKATRTNGSNEKEPLV